MMDCTLDQFGNYTVQDIVEVASKLRTALSMVPSVAGCITAFKNENRGLDPLGEGGRRHWGFGA